MNALHDYVVKMTKDELPPAKAFWSLTLYDTENGFFIPNPRNKYSVGENAGYKLNADGGIEIYVAAEKPAGVPEENWLPINRGDEGIGGLWALAARGVVRKVRRVRGPSVQQRLHDPPTVLDRIRPHEQGAIPDHHVVEQGFIADVGLGGEPVIVAEFHLHRREVERRPAPLRLELHQDGFVGRDQL